MILIVVKNKKGSKKTIKFQIKKGKNFYFIDRVKISKKEIKTFFPIYNPVVINRLEKNPEFLLFLKNRIKKFDPFYGKYKIKKYLPMIYFNDFTLELNYF